MISRRQFLTSFPLVPVPKEDAQPVRFQGLLSDGAGHELEDGFFYIGERKGVMVPEGDPDYEGMRKLENKTVRITIAPIEVPEL